MKRIEKIKFYHRSNFHQRFFKFDYQSHSLLIAESNDDKSLAKAKIIDLK